jgi:hypothetical protein
MKNRNLVPYGISFNNDKLYLSDIEFFTDKDYKEKIKPRFSSSSNKYYFYHPRVNKSLNILFKRSDKISSGIEFNYEEYFCTLENEILRNFDTLSKESYSIVRVKKSDWIAKTKDGELHVRMTIISNFHNDTNKSADTVYLYGKSKIE